MARLGSYPMVLGALTVLTCGWACSEPAASRAKAPQSQSSRPRVAVGVSSEGGDELMSDQPLSIALENTLPGVAHDEPDNPASGQVEGYASAVSAAAGETIQLFVNVDHDQNVGWDLYRVGYYGGLGTRLVTSAAPQPVSVQPACPVDSSTGLIECAWAPAFDVTIAAEWVSGYYYFELVNDDGFATRVPLIVREGSRRAPGLVQASVTTWQAYNVWGGTSLYDNKLPESAPYQGKHARRVSFERPYQEQNELPAFLDTVRFLERRGYDLSYTTNVDIDADARVLAGRKLFMTVAHDEYWSVPERNALEQARDQGVSLAFFSANTGYWRIRLEPSTGGIPRRTETCYKSSSADPIRNAPDTTALFHGKPFPRPENALIGVAFRTWSSILGFPYIVTNPDHWIYEGTGVKQNDALGNVVGAEWDGVTDNGKTPAGLEVVAAATTIDNDGAFVAGAANATVYYPTPSSLVFAAGTIDWGYGLGSGPYSDARVQRVTENVLARAGLLAQGPATTVTRVAMLPAAESKILAGTGVAGGSDGPALTATFDGPIGLAAGPNGELYIADGGNRAVRTLSPEGIVSTLVAGASEKFRMPVGIAVDAHGVLYVSDSISNQIMKVSTDGTVAPYAGTGDSGAADAADPLSASFSGPRGIAIGPADELYVADTKNNAIRRIDAVGVTTVATEVASVDAVAAAPDGALYFSTIASAQIGVVRNGQVRILANVPGEPGNREGAALQARLQPGEGLIVEADRVVLADTENDRVRALSLTGTPLVSTLFGDGNAAADANDAAHTWLPRGIAKLNGGYAVADFATYRILWFKDAASIP